MESKAGEVVYNIEPIRNMIFELRRNLANNTRKEHLELCENVIRHVQLHPLSRDSMFDKIVDLDINTMRQDFYNFRKLVSDKEQYDKFAFGYIDHLEQIQKHAQEIAKSIKYLNNLVFDTDSKFYLEEDL
jgi:hypothetical protein